MNAPRTAALESTSRPDRPVSILRVSHQPHGTTWVTVAGPGGLARLGLIPPSRRR